MENKNVENIEKKDILEKNTERKSNRLCNEKQRKKKRNKEKNGKNSKITKKKVLTIMLIALLVLILIIGVVAGTYIYKAEGDITTAALNMAADVLGEDDPIFVLVLGVSEDIKAALTDTIILAGYNPDSQKAFMLSIPRDTFIGKSEAWASGYDKINALYQKGPEETVEAVEKLTGINIDNYVIVKNTALPAIVEAIGEVEFDVPIDMDYDDPTQNLHIHLEAGVQMINGEEAEQLLRFRHNNDGSSYPSEYGDNDYGRMRTQREFIKAVASQLISGGATVSNLKNIGTAVFNNLVTDMSLSKILSYAPSAIKLNIDGIRMEQLPGSSAMINNLWFYKSSTTKTNELISELLTELELDEKELKEYYTGKITKTTTSSSTQKNNSQTTTNKTTTEKTKECTEHNYASEIITKPTCKSEGTRKYTCTVCKYTYNEPLAKTTDHNYSKGKCTICGKKDENYKTEEEEECSHNYKTTTTDPTCLKDGSEITKCTLCGDVKSKTTRPAIGHKFTNGVCSNCGAEDPNVPKECTHNYVTTTVPATCEGAGSETTKCTLCGDVKSQTTIPAKGHTYTNGVCSCGATDPNYTPPPAEEEPEGIEE